MFKRKDDIRTFIVIVIVCLLCIGIALIISHKNNYEKIENVNDYGVFFSNINYINTFINAIATKDSVYIYNLLDKKYIKNNNITTNNVLDYFDNYSILSSFDISDMLLVNIKKDFIYYIKGKIYENSYDQNRKIIDEDFSVALAIDGDNNSYSIYPVDNDYIDVINSYRKVSIENNTYNKIGVEESISSEQICAIYLSDFTNAIFNDYDDAYNLLSEDMKKEYTSVDSFKKYIINNFELISTTADKCRVEESDNGRTYTVLDTNNNTYVFNEKSIMNYKVNFYLNK